MLCLPTMGVKGRVPAPYHLDWSTIDGSGGFSRGGAYDVWGTAAQPDAGLMAGGGYGLNGSFWGGLHQSPEPRHRSYLLLVLRDGP